MAISIREEDLTPQEQEFLRYARQMPDEDQQALLRAMHYVATDPDHGCVTQHLLEQLVKQMKYLH